MGRLLLQPHGRRRGCHGNGRTIRIFVGSRTADDRQEIFILERGHGKISMQTTFISTTAAHVAAEIAVNDLRKVYRDSTGDVVAIDGLDLQIRAGEFLCILGPSGCGKSSLLNILAGFEAPSSGTATLNGEPIDGPSRLQGVVFQDTAALFPWLTVYENVAFGLKNVKLSKAQKVAKIQSTLKLVGLQDFGEKWPHQLSGGMRQLASIARVLVTDSRVLLMDEPFAALDAMTRQKMQQKLIEIWQATNITILLITHSVDEAIYLGNRTLVFTQRPARIAVEIPVDLPHPRSVTDSEFNRLKLIALTHLGF
ncbi:ABC transporter ATP-binding protein [Candidimonas sp. SYP-B2681]|nr:ABC transporter ATP-binding protein [Candidimonas sp. SYP-B2681]